MTLPTLVRGRSGVLLGTALAEVVVLLPGMPGLPLTLAGLWLLFGAPVAVWRGTASRAVSGRDAGLMLAIGLAVITDMVVALGVNTLLPLFGAAHPLTRTNLAGAMAMVMIVIGAFVPEEEREKEREQERAKRSRARRRPRGLIPLVSLGVLTLVLSVAGPVRLNNGQSGVASTVALVAVAGLLALLMFRRRDYSVPVLESGLYVAAVALLLLNSLRGWTIAGHDIQREYEYFRLTLGGSLWNVQLYPDAYNACLSITILPVSLVRLTAIPDIYVFKVVLPLLFALCPVLVHRSVRNVASQPVALLSAVFFMAFPTFFTDMTFLGRQEIAFLLIGCVMVVLTDRGRPLLHRRLMVSVLLVGCVLSHYSTTYIVVATLGIAFVADLIWRLTARRASRRPRRKGLHEQTRGFVTWWMVLVPAVLALVWAGPVTNTNVQLRTTLGAAVTQLLHPGKGHAGSSDTSYSIFGGAKASPAERMNQYRADTITATTAQRAAGDYLPLKALQPFQTPVVAPQNQPLTGVGKALQATGLSVSGLNGLLRQGTALLLQLLVLVGFGVAMWSRRRRFQPTRDQVTLTVGALAVVATFTLLPQLSVDYSVLRAFQQGLFFYAPFLATGALWLLRWAGRRTVPLTCALVASMFLDLSGVVPKVLGGYPAQLQLSNAGQYYDIYYPHDEERDAAFWIEQQIAPDRRQILQTDRFAFSRLQTLITGSAQGDIYPTLIRPNSYVLLGATTLQKDEVTVFYQGDLITYRYPKNLLDTSKNLIYSSEGAVIYR
ncbi:DUF2206 domain-containing protein [Kitasatospora sp. MAP5-34]|uniref:DUF2206 domain-containing protein n=1 Tax=Kitasatospora sp. MAP5-34 TaxID=3035102 RepID=UPI002473272B|nr:DUF2206 domain-containing protein [Kitasatospora sp. MAP5-34]MDH6578060.1 putative membrane protein [Kitasatospora sp. MAP5-34]